MASDEVRSDITAHRGTYVRFLSLLKNGAIASAIIAALVILIIAR